MERQLTGKICDVLKGAGYMLDPEFWQCNAEEDPEVVHAFEQMVDLTYFLPDTLSDDASLEDKAKRAELVQTQERLRDQCHLDLVSFKRKVGAFARPRVQGMAKKMAACEWWRQYGGEVPALRKVACRVLGQVAGAGAAERGHKEMNFLKSKSRNRLSITTTDKLVYVRHNLSQKEKIEAIGGDHSIATDWSEIVITEDTEWTDAWQGARDEEDAAYQASREVRVARMARRAQVMVESQSRRLAPDAGEMVDDGGPVIGVTRSGRTIRRPGALSDFIAM